MGHNSPCSAPCGSCSSPAPEPPVTRPLPVNAAQSTQTNQSRWFLVLTPVRSHVIGLPKDARLAPWQQTPIPPGTHLPRCGSKDFKGGKQTHREAAEIPSLSG